ncbi:MAG: GatB/YqeY domain-containing protein [Gemmatimonadaceae bacterium]
MSTVVSLQSRLAADLTAARKSQQKAATLLLGSTLSEIRNREIELKRDLTDDDVIEVLRRGIKKRRESVEIYEKAGRTELAATERQEVALLETYLPAQVNPEEIRAAVRAAIAGGAANVGAVMGKVMPQFKGRADGSAINAIAREELAGK